jgi:hypothetical protein
MRPTTKTWRSARRWLPLLLLLFSWRLPTSRAALNGAIITIGDHVSWYPYRFEVADFGDPLPKLHDSSEYRASLMTPPDEKQLCKFPESLMDGANRTSPLELHTHVALLVSLGGCDVLTKATVALDIYQKVSNAVRYIVFYNNDADNPDEIVPLKAPEWTIGAYSPEDFESIAFISVSTHSGNSMLGRMEKLSLKTETSPEFRNENNIRWSLPMVLERADRENSYRDPYASPRATAGNFYWFRFVLFTLLIVSPCCRAGYLWWAGGGRIGFRRDEDGRIVGFRYIPPMSYWFASIGVQDSFSSVTDRLTEEQVLALPEIPYKAPPEDHDENKDELDEVDIVVCSGSADAEQELADAKAEGPLLDDKPVNTNTNTSADADEEQAVLEAASLDTVSLETTVYTTCCTCCSICIDEFEDGEPIRLLPRCKHAFHTECIMPWLTERQGCCPLCKASVLEPEGGEDETSDDVSVDEEHNSNNVEGNTESTHNSIEGIEPESQDVLAGSQVNPVAPVEDSAATADTEIHIQVVSDAEPAIKGLNIAKPAPQDSLFGRAAESSESVDELPGTERAPASQEPALDKATISQEEKSERTLYTEATPSTTVEFSRPGVER